MWHYSPCASGGVLEFDQAVLSCYEHSKGISVLNKKCNLLKNGWRILSRIVFLNTNPMRFT